jgi:hypothetical protein
MLAASLSAFDRAVEKVAANDLWNEYTGSLDFVGSRHCREDLVNFTCWHEPADPTVAIGW